MAPQKLKIIIVILLSMLYYTAIKAQTIDVDIDVEDDFLKMPLQGVKVSLLTTDSMVVVDSLKSVSVRDSRGRLLREVYTTPIKAEKRNYLVRTSRAGYGEVWKPLSVLFTEVSAVKLDIKMRRAHKLGEATVTATKVKMYYKGDTLVYNADAFKLPDGSMLDALINQLPGVTMDNSGQIFVNGRKIDELLLGSRTFMSGNKKVLMENLPYYTVKDLKVYEKQSAQSEALGYDVEPRKYVMDVSLKKEYSRGYIANVEVAGGTQERWLGRGFLLGFTDRWRYSLMANANNVNESRHIGQHGHWTPATMPKSLFTTRSVGTDLEYLSKDKNLSNTLNADYSSTSTESEMRQRYEQFLEGSKPISRTENRHESDNQHWKVKNFLESKKPFYYSFETWFDYEKREDSGQLQFEQQDDTPTASMRSDNMGKGRNWAFAQSANVTFNINKGKEWNGNAGIYFRHSNNRSWQSGRYDTWQEIAQDNSVRYNAGDVSNRLTYLSLSSYLTFSGLLGKADLVIGENFQYNYYQTHDYLYHPDTLLLASQLDMLESITDHSNSYDSQSRQITNMTTINVKRTASYGFDGQPYHIVYSRWELGLDVPVYHRSLDYRRGIIDTLMHDTQVYPSPHAAFNHITNNRRHQLRISANHKQMPAELMDQIAYRDDSRPLVVREGNAALKGSSTTSARADYTRQKGKLVNQWHIGTSFDYHHRDVAQSVTYNPQTGVYTYKPMNVKGAYRATAKFDISSMIDKKRYWTWQMNANANYTHAVDHAMLAGETESRENAVNTTTLHDGAYIQYNRGAFNIRLSGDVSWRHSEGDMYDFTTLNAFDFNYGLSARYTIPRIKTTLSADATMYSRRGYGSSELNTDDFVLNASVSQSFLKGKLIARIEAFDLLHQLSSTQYSVNALGRTETWYRSLPHYVMLHLVYHWNRNPKKR